MAGGSLCRDCMTLLPSQEARRCPSCSSPRMLRHKELTSLTIAHVDCDAFYASVEKRDNPEIRDKPVIVGGSGRRGVVSTCCYMARTYGVHSAQPMFMALKRCPDAVVVPPSMSRYSSIGKEIRERMKQLTPIVEPLSIDEAFLDLTGTERLHGRTAAETMSAFAAEIEREMGLTVSVGLSYCKFLAKIASDLDKPRGYSIIGQEEAVSFLAKQSVSIIYGVGKAFQKTLARDGISTIGQIQKMDEAVLAKKYGVMGLRLSRLSHGDDTRLVNPKAPMKSISNEITFRGDISSYVELEKILWRMCEKVSKRAKASHQAGETITVKMKTSKFKTKSRSRTLSSPTQMANRIFEHACELLEPECDGTPYRLLGVGLANICNDDFSDPPDLIDQHGTKRTQAERAMDTLRDKYGDDAIKKGRSG
jgi:DNA polymerase IV